LTLAGLALVTAGLPVAAPAQAQAETCQGKTVTIVGGQGTDGDDVIKSSGPVHAGAGDDTVCSEMGVIDGGPGVDSIEVHVWGQGEGGVTVVDFEHFDMKTAFNLGENRFEWTVMPTELSGTVDGYSFGGRAGMVLDNPTAYFTAPKGKDVALKVDLRRGTVSLGEGLGLAITGFADVGATAHKVRFIGDSGRNFMFLAGCDVLARGGDGPDRMWMQKTKVGKTCPGARLYGQGDNDKMIGTGRNDVLVGGQGRDRADARGGRRDLCIAEKKTGCER
jgi:Ca2+-binding RTX toxin-like protein